jgi:hypothetical protein
MPDDKFIDAYIEMSERYIPNQSSYIIFGNRETPHFVKSKSANILYLNKSKTSYDDLNIPFNKIETIIFHRFKKDHLNFIEKIPSEITKIWIVWGFEIYNIFPQSNLINLLSYVNQYQPYSLMKIKGYINHYRFKWLYHRKETVQIIKKMDYCATWLPYDYSLAKSINPAIKRLYFRYLEREMIGLDKLDEKKPDLNRLLLGNSAAMTNNHLEALDYLKKIKYSGVIIYPLSYSNVNHYKESLIRKGKKLFGERFQPLTEFLPLDKYHSIINSCGIIWMNQRRQQAAGNLIVGFSTNKIITLNDENPLKQAFEDWGLQVFNPSILKKLNDFDFSRLAENKNIINKKLREVDNKPFFDFIGKKSASKFSKQ